MRVLYTIPGMDAVAVRRDETYRVTDTGALTIDLYDPPGAKEGGKRPAVLFVTGFPDAGAERRLGAKFKDLGSFVCWGQLVAASGLVGMTYSNQEPGDVVDVLRHVREHAGRLGIDCERLGIWACSGHAPNALATLMDERCAGVRCAALAYPYTLDLDGATNVADAAKSFGFVTAPAGKSVNDVPRDIPLFVARAGADRMPGLNHALDRFLSAALDSNLPVTLANHATGVHAFDLVDDSRTSRGIVSQILTFLRLYLEE